MRNKYYDAYRIFNYHVKVKNKNNNDYKKISSKKKKCIHVKGIILHIYNSARKRFRRDVNI